MSPSRMFYVCPVCGSESDPFAMGGGVVANQGPPPEANMPPPWIGIQQPTVLPGIEYLCSWECMVTFAEGKVAELAAEAEAN